ncbi:MAG: hypothetical protein M3P52_01030 [Actinomycetota bacterium]|nr:hypothetical protein [Actinomycetota bacterium]
MRPWVVVRCAALVATRPWLWMTALRQYRAGLPRRWWARRPFLPIPPGDYVRFRLQTQYGAADHRIEAVDVLNYLSWCKLHRAVAS